MCLAVTGKVVELQDMLGRVELKGMTRDVSFMLLPEAKVGDYVLLHAGFAMQVVSESDVEETNALLAEMRGEQRVVHELRQENQGA